MRPLYRGCLNIDNNKWFLDLRPDFRLDRVCSKISYRHQLRNFLLKYNFSQRHIYTPRNEVRGGYTGITMSVRLSVRPSVCPAAFGFPAHNCFPFTPIIMKLHMQTPHEARMRPIDFEVQRSRSQCINYWKWFPAHNCFPFTPIIMKLHMQTPHESRMCPIDFKVKGQGHNA